MEISPGQEKSRFMAAVTALAPNDRSQLMNMCPPLGKLVASQPWSGGIPPVWQALLVGWNRGYGLHMGLLETA